MKYAEEITRRQLLLAFGSSRRTGNPASVGLTANRADASVTLSASDGSAALIPGADAVSAGVMTAADKVKLDGLLPTHIRDFSSFSDIRAATVGSAVSHLRTASHTSRGDGGGGLYRRVEAEPGHAGKVQSADGAWWELVPQGGRIYAEQFGADGTGADDAVSAFGDALSYAAGQHVTLVAKNKYSLKSTLVFPSGQYGFEGPDIRNILAASENGFIWNGGNNEVGLEIRDVEMCRFSGALVINNRGTQARNFKGILFRATSSGGAITNSNFEMIGVFGASVGVQIGDYSNDRYDTNWEQSVI